MKISSAGRSHIGRRDNNEDSYCVEPGLGLFVVADGMGGYEGGEVASALAVEAVRELVQRDRADADATWPFRLQPGLTRDENLIAVGARAAHSAICAHKQGRRAQMGSTLVSLLVGREQAVIGHVGDSRVYRWRAGELEQLTRDHSLHAEMQAAGMTDVPSRAACGFANVITRALGTQCAEPELRREPLRAGDRFLLCSDGLIEQLEDPAIREILSTPGAEQACERLIDAALRLGTRDNITAVVVEVAA